MGGKGQKRPFGRWKAGKPGESASCVLGNRALEEISRCPVEPSSPGVGDGRRCTPDPLSPGLA